MSENATPSRCGFVAVLGAPNAGKSTMVNRAVGQKVSIVSPKVQTTRSRVLGIVSQGTTQIVLVDTPGIFAPRRRLDRAMVAAAWGGAADADAIVLIVDAARKSIDDETRGIIAGLKQQQRKVILALNKIDIVKREKLLALTAELNAEGIFTDIFMISAETGDGVDDLLQTLAQRMPEGPHHYPDDQVTDVPMRALASEITREQLFRQLQQELPYALTVETDSWEEFDDGSAKIQQTIFVARDSQKGIVVGKGGDRIRQVREAAQRELQALMDRKVHLFLFVKVRENWAEDPEHFRNIGLDFEV
ncbi:GTPase Era [Dongia sedimenti]|uniref:GTPase Era n=1 Tax=Dongia sedimenti TaxID=3064282 RepID=A0ABU0YUT2_9PROT|nr:GTPase Era [Rhodospirillaceae bacterium R-7]